VYIQVLPKNEYMEIEVAYKKLMDCAYAVHKALGPGLLESAYEECLYFELNEAGLFVEKQKTLPLVYKTIKLDAGYRVDLMIEKQIIVEIKSVETMKEIFTAQTLTYMKLANCKLGMLINFNVSLLKTGMNRLIL
jgi:GxxExxY protein